MSDQTRSQRYCSRPQSTRTRLSKHGPWPRSPQCLLLGFLPLSLSYSSGAANKSRPLSSSSLRLLVIEIMVLTTASSVSNGVHNLHHITTSIVHAHCHSQAHVALPREKLSKHGCTLFSWARTPLCTYKFVLVNRHERSHDWVW